MSRHIRRPGGNLIDPQAELSNSLERLVSLHPPDSLAPSGGLYTGLLSVVFLFWKLGEFVSVGRRIDGLSIKDWRDAYWTQARRYDRALLGEVGIDSLKIRPWRCGVGEDTIVYAALRAIFALEQRQSESEAEARSFCRAVKQVLGSASIAQERRHGKPASNEWLYGRAGTLYLLRTIRQVAGQLDEPGTLLSEIDDTIHALIEEIVAAPRPWVWHGKPYLGAVHGSAGIVSQVIQSMQAINLRDRPLLETLQTDVEQILGLQMPSGNWPSSILPPNAQPAQDRLLQFCHGSPGIIPCLHHISSAYPSLSDRIAEAISRAESDILARGWLTKEPCLCHGATGNATALATEESRMSLLRGATERSIEQLQETGDVGLSDSPEGLYTGVAGRAWVWALCGMGEDRRGSGSFLGFDDV